MNERRPLGKRLTAERGGPQRGEVHVNQGHGVFGNGAGVGDHHGHDVAHVVHLGVGNRGVVRHHQSGQQPAGGNAAHLLHVLAGQHRVHAGQRQGRRGVDLADLRVGVGATQHGGVKLAMHVDVVGVAACTRDETRVFHTLDRLAHEFLGAGGGDVVGIGKLGHGVLLWSEHVACGRSLVETSKPLSGAVAGYSGCSYRPRATRQNINRLRLPVRSVFLPSGQRRAARLSRCCGSRCSGRNCLPASAESRRHWGWDWS